MHGLNPLPYSYYPTSLPITATNESSHVVVNTCIPNNFHIREIMFNLFKIDHSDIFVKKIRKHTGR